MLRVVLLLFLLLAPLLAACSSGGGGPAYTGPRAQVSYAEGGAPALLVRVSDLPAGSLVRDVALAGPKQTRIGGTELEESRQPAPSSGSWRPTVGVGASGGSKSGVDPSVSLSWPADAPRQTVALWMIPLPDFLGTGRLDGRDWKVEVDYLDSDGIGRTLRLNPPPN